ncbi:MAG: chorismate synthase [Rhodospirillales bacterium]|nr:chorismate synthase [Rhodospirillales bacterium]
MSGNTFGHLFRVTTFGESHGPAIGGIVDGVPPGIALAESDIQPYLDRRRPGQSRFTTQRRERDKVHVFSGVFEGKTTGAPIGFAIFNEDARSKDYETIKDVFRPGHADYTYLMKYGIRDYRGSGRASARETAVRVAAGAIARKVLGDSVVIRGALIQMGGKRIERNRWNWREVTRNSFFCPDARAARAWEAYLDGIRKKGSSIGAIIEVVAEGVPAGLGEPVFDRLDADIAKAMMSIPAVKGVEIGAGFAAAALTGPENADHMRAGPKGRPRFLSNNAGGILGGISTGQDIVVRFAVKPTSSILIPQPTVTVQGKNTTVSTKGRHDPCVGIRAVPIGEAMLALVLADHFLRQRGQCGK